jgi:hypothetical protein
MTWVPNISRMCRPVIPSAMYAGGKNDVSRSPKWTLSTASMA